MLRRMFLNASKYLRKSRRGLKTLRAVFPTGNVSNSTKYSPPNAAVVSFLNPSRQMVQHGCIHGGVPLQHFLDRALVTDFFPPGKKSYPIIVSVLSFSESSKTGAPSQFWILKKNETRARQQSQIFFTKGKRSRREEAIVLQTNLKRQRSEKFESFFDKSTGHAPFFHLPKALVICDKRFRYIVK